MDRLAIGEPQLVDAARMSARSGRKRRCCAGFPAPRCRTTRSRPAAGRACVRLVGDGHDVADRLQRIGAHLRLRQVGAGDDFRRARVADIDRREILRRAFMREPQDAPPVLGELHRHAFAHPAEAVERVVPEQLEIPHQRVARRRALGHVGLIGKIGGAELVGWPSGPAGIGIADGAHDSRGATAKSMGRDRNPNGTNDGRTTVSRISPAGCFMA